MEFVRAWFPVAFRRDRRQILAVVILLGLLGGVSLLALAGARRTQSAYPRFLRAANASTMSLDPGQYDPAVDAAIAARPEVAESTAYVAFSTGVLVDGLPDFDQNFETLGTFDGRFFTMDRFTPTEGRMPDVARPDEIAVNETAAQLFGYKVGQQLDLGTYSYEQVSDENFIDDPPAPKVRSMATIVGIGLFIDEVVQDDTNRSPLVLVTPAFTKAAAPLVGYAWQGLTLRNGDADVAAVKSWYVDQLPPGSPQFFRVTSVDTFHALQSIRPLSLALALFGVIASIATLLLVSQAAGRWLHRGRQEQDVVRALGAQPKALLATSLAVPMIALMLGSVTAVAVAFFASPLMPLGSVRRVEVARGFDADWTVLGVGGVVLFVLLAAVTIVSAIRGLPDHRGAGQRTPRRSLVANTAASTGFPPPAVNGIRLAVEPGEGATAVPVRSVMLGAAIAITTVVAALTFGASFRTLLDSPDLYGWTGDAVIFDQSGYGDLSVDAAHQQFDDDPHIAGWSGAYFGANSVDGVNLPLLGMAVDSTVVPPILRGRMIENDGEIVLGSATSDTLGKDVGDTITIGAGTETSQLTVVGVALFPTIGIGHGAHTSLGVGALVVPERVPGFARAATGDGPPGSSPTGLPGPPGMFVRFAPGADPVEARAAVEAATPSISQYPGSAVVLGPQRPAEIVNSSNVGRVPMILAVVLAVAAAISLGLALAASVRRRRHELAILQSLGFTRGQLSATIAWQATATVAVAALVGVPLGVVLGRALWTAFADQLDVLAEPATPIMVLCVVVIMALVIANVAAAIPAAMARRLSTARLLRAE